MLFYLLSALGLVPTFQKTKCKRLLNLTLERIKLLEKRHLARLRQLHKDVIELWQLNKMHKMNPLLLRISKEQCLGSVYVTTAEYCELVQSNLKNIAGQSACPKGLKEPVAGLCFAASCCADLPELQELREIFAMKYDKEIVSSIQDLKPNCNINRELLDNLYAKDPSDTKKQELLEEIIAQCKLMPGHEQDMQQWEIHDSVSIDNFVDANELQEGIDCTITDSEVKDQSECEALQQVDVVQEPDCMETVCNEDVESTEFAHRKRTLEDRETHCSAFKRAYRRKFWHNKAMEGEAKGSEEHEEIADKVHDSAEVCIDTGRRLVSVHHDAYKNFGVFQGEGMAAHMKEHVAPNQDLHVLRYVEQPPCSQPPQRPPPPPPPKQAPPLPPSLETYGSYVHPRLPRYEDLVANFTALKR